MEAEERVGWIVVLAIILCAAVTAVRHAREARVLRRVAGCLSSTPPWFGGVDT